MKLHGSRTTPRVPVRQGMSFSRGDLGKSSDSEKNVGRAFGCANSARDRPLGSESQRAPDRSLRSRPMEINSAEPVLGLPKARSEGSTHPTGSLLTTTDADSAASGCR